MNKFTVLFVLTLLAVSMTPVMARESWVCNYYRRRFGTSSRWVLNYLKRNCDPLFELILVEKDSVWNIVPGGAKGKLKQIVGSYWVFNAMRLDPRTGYTLIYYGDDTHNDVWPYATCIDSKTSNIYGKVHMEGLFGLEGFFNDGINQKIWLVTSSDVDCAAGKMIDWNPADYLFEHNTI